MEATERYLSRDNRAVNAVASVVTSIMTPPQSGSMTRSSGMTSPVAQVTSTFRSMINSLRGINNEKNKQRELLIRVRRSADEDRREQGMPIRDMPEQAPEERENTSILDGILRAISLVLKKIFSAIKTILTFLTSMIGRIVASVLRTGMRVITSAVRGLLAGIASIMRNPRLRLLAAGATAAAGIAAYIFGRGDEPEPTGVPGQAPSAPPGSSQRIPESAPPGGAPIPSNSSLPIDYAAYAQRIGQRESNSNYQAVNTIGFLGKYQFGYMALIDMGLVRRGVTSNRQLDNPSNWTIEGGKQAFLNNPQLQEDTMVRYTNQNFRALNRLGVINAESSNEQIAGFLAAAHLLGPGGARNLAQGRDGADAYGTSGASYYRLGAATQTAGATPQPSPTQARSQVAFAPGQQRPPTMVAAAPAAAAPTTAAPGQPVPGQPAPDQSAPITSPEAVASMPTSGMGATETITQVQPIIIRERVEA